MGSRLHIEFQFCNLHGSTSDGSSRPGLIDAASVLGDAMILQDICRPLVSRGNPSRRLPGRVEGVARRPDASSFRNSSAVPPDRRADLRAHEVSIVPAPAADGDDADLGARRGLHVIRRVPNDADIVGRQPRRCRAVNRMAASGLKAWASSDETTSSIRSGNPRDFEEGFQLVALGRAGDPTPHAVLLQPLEQRADRRERSKARADRQPESGPGASFNSSLACAP